MKKCIFTLLLAVCLMTGLSISSAFAAEVSFTDTSGHWAEEAIASVVDKGLFNGTSDTTFSPDVSMDRGMFVTVLGRFAEKMGAEIKGTASFGDVPDNAYYAPYVAWAADNGIVKGTSETTFSPTDSVTREQMCALFIRLLDYAKYSVPAGTELTFTDSAAISDYAKSNVQSSVELGLIKGVETADGMAFQPAASATRAQVATVFLRLDGLEGIYDVLKPSVDPAPVDPTPVDPTPVNPTPVNPTPVNPTPVNPTPAVEPTDEEKAAEAEVAGYLITMLNNYNSTKDQNNFADKVVLDCMDLIMTTLQDALNERDRGTFLSKEYVDEAYADKISEAKALYKSMTSDQKSQMQSIAAGLEKLSHLKTALNYFGFSGVL